MYRALIVDDEPLMIDVLRNIVDWGKAGFEAVDEAFNGEEALKIIRSRPVDVVLTDLKMPLMNGLELVLNTRAFNPEIRFVIVSAYDEFHMVSSAFKLGAEEYLLKDELTGEQVSRVLDSVKAGLRREQEKKEQAERQKSLEQEAYQNTQKLRRHIDRNQDIIQEKALRGAIWGGGRPEEELLAELSDLGCRLNARRKVLINVWIDDYDRLEKHVWEGNSELLHHAVFGVIEDVLGKHGIGDAFRKTQGQYVLIVCFDDRLREGSVRELVICICNEVRESVGAHLHVKAVCGVSGVATGLGCMQNLYNQADKACRYSFVMGKDRIIFHDSLPPDGRGQSPSMAEKANMLKEFLPDMQKEAVNRAADKLCIDERQVFPDTVDDVKRLFDKYFMYLSDAVEQRQAGDAAREAVQKYNGYLREYGGLSERNKWLAGCLSALASTAGEGSRLISRAKRYINKHFRENISLSGVAFELGVNASYLSRTFSREAGYSLMEYIAQVRMEVAINYIRTTNLKIYEIAEKVGYTNTEHFSRMFKKVTGKSPRDIANQS